MSFAKFCVPAGDLSLLGSSLDRGEPAAVTGCAPAYRAAVTAALTEDAGRPAVVICPNEYECARFASDLRVLTRRGVFVFPARDLLLGAVSGSREYEREALGVLDAAARGEAGIIVTTAEAVCRYTLPAEVLEARTFTLSAGAGISPARLAEKLVSAGYVSADPVTAKGQFFARGGITDVFPSGNSRPVRIEFYGDTIDRMAYFDPESQRRTGPAEELRIVPAAEIFPDDPDGFCERLSAFCSGLRGKSAALYRTRAQADVDAVRAGMRIGYERYVNLIHPSAATVFDYLERPMCFVSDYSRVAESQKAFSERFTYELAAASENGYAAKGADDFYMSASDLDVILGAAGTVYFEAFALASLTGRVRRMISARCSSGSVFTGDVPALAETLGGLLEKKYFCVVAAPTKRAAAALTGDLTGLGLSCSGYSFGGEPAAGVVNVAEGSFSGSFTLTPGRVCLITGQAAQKRREAPARRRDALHDIAELKAGDYVVHQLHGIGVYRGIETLTAGGATKDYLKISYEGTDVLYLPVTQLDMLSKYIGAGEEGKVKLNKLGSAKWQATRKRVKASVRDMADELVKLYARRARQTGHAFSPDQPWQAEFEQRFEYEETEDQLRCVREIKEDMESPVPMDRLLCGDVGYGKTEVALRAVFKCVMDGKQAAILAPTTILAWQHYETVTRRMGPFGINVALLSRFAADKQTAGTLADLQSGRADVTVGTHRLLQKDISFRDLGLVIVDEEQRFGVAQKEKLKSKYPGVDVLTLSATPIPRTMNMAISGIRDMSVIEEPPLDRHPVQTFVAEYDFAMLAEAVRRELRRGGQVYWLHNRIESIPAVVARLSSQLPGTSVAGAHGQMEKEELAEIWRRMSEGEISVLVCTTIIEAGVDIANVNTLIIEDADRFGLSQLHQIRGRVGRSPRRAFAYLTFRPGKALSEIAEKRLEAIKEFTEFGAGYSVAVRDMEIRGAGNLLGAKQHGHMSAVGYDMYLKLLAEAVGEAKGEKAPRPREPALINLPVDAHIPAEYIAEPGQRIDIYRKIAEAVNRTQEEAVLSELTDRFGAPPEQVQMLMTVARLRNRATALGISEVAYQGGCLRLYMKNPDRADACRLEAALGPERVKRFPRSSRPYVSVSSASSGVPGLCGFAERVLKLMQSAQ